MGPGPKSKQGPLKVGEPDLRIYLSHGLMRMIKNKGREGKLSPPGAAPRAACRATP